MFKDDDIRILAEEVTSSCNENKEHTEEERKAKGQDTLGKPSMREQKEPREKGQVAETKTVGGKIT